MPTPEPIVAGTTSLKLDIQYQPDGTVRPKAAGDTVANTGGFLATAAAAVQELKAPTATRTSVAAADANTLVLAANADRKGFIVVNDSDKTLYLGFGTTAASSTDYTVPIPAGITYECLFPTTFQLRGRWAAGPTGSARVTELT